MGIGARKKERKDVKVREASRWLAKPFNAGCYKAVGIVIVKTMNFTACGNEIPALIVRVR